MFRRLTGAALAAAALCGLSFGLGLAPAVATAAPATEVYGRLPYIDADQFKLSASGRLIAFVARGDDGLTRHLVVRDLTTGATLTQAAITENKIRGLAWAGDDFVLITTSSTLNNQDSSQTALGEFTQVVSLNIKTGHSLAIFFKEKKIYPAVFDQFGVIQKDGHWYGYFEGLTKQGSGDSHTDFDRQEYTLVGATYDLYRVDLDTGNPHRVVQGGRYAASWSVNPAGEVQAFSSYDVQTGRWVLYGPDGRAELMSVDSPLHDTGLAGAGRTPGTVLVVSHDPEQGGFIEVDVNNRNRTDLLPGQPIDGSFTGEDGSLVGASVYGDRTRSVFFDPAVQAAWEKASRPFKGLTVSYVSADASWKKWILLTEGDGDSGTYWMVDLITKKAEQIASAYPEVTPSDVAPSRIVAYKAADGTEMQGVLTLPLAREAKGLPLVVLPHSGSRDTLRFNWLAQAFAAKGYAVFQPNYRGSTGFTLDFRYAGHGEWGRKMQTDISDGVVELGRQGLVDPKRACIVGWSYGGYAALAGVTIQNGLYRCAVSYGGLTDMTVLMRDDKGQNPTFRTWKTFLGARSLGDPVIRQYSPALQAAKADAPILLIHGKTDSVVPIQQARLMQSGLKDAHKPFEYLEVEGDHWLSDEPSRIAMIRAAVAFVVRNNPPD